MGCTDVACMSTIQGNGNFSININIALKNKNSVKIAIHAFDEDQQLNAEI